MKKLRFLLLFSLAALLASLIWFSCAKENIKPPAETTSPNEADYMGNVPVGERTLICDSTLSKVTRLPNGMLSFPALHVFEHAVECLEDAVDAYNDAFEAAHPGLTDDQINALIDSLGWNEDQPLIDFENSLGFSSLRASIEAQETTWLNNSVLDPNTDPDDHIITDEETRSLLTPDCKVMIGGQVIDFCTPDNGNTFQSLGLCLNGCCFWGKRSRDLEYENGNKKIIVYVSLRNKTAFPAKAKAKIKSLKQSGGKWKRHRTPLRITIGGAVFDLNGCGDTPASFGDGKPDNGGTKRKKKLRVAVNNWATMRFARDNDISATGFQGSSQSVFRSVFLTF